jgi:hypothetical protein
MKNSNNDGVVDLETCHESGGVPPGSNRFRIRIDDERYVVDDATPVGRQILALTDLRPIDEHLLFMLVRGGKFEEIRLDELVDLRTPGVERFITFESAASFRFVIDGERIEHGTPLITGKKLKEIANVNPDTYALWMEVRGAEDEPITDETVVDLSRVGLERFFTVIEETTAGETAVLPSRDRRYLEAHGYQFEELVKGAQRGLVIKDHGLDNPNLSERCADILILLPTGYPDVPPDMFYCLPWLRLVTSQGFPDRADQPFSFAGQDWQRWSRHNDQWRPGKDGIWSMLRRVERALLEAG